MTCEHRGRGVGPSWACAALSKLLRVCLTPSERLLSISHICVSGRDGVMEVGRLRFYTVNRDVLKLPDTAPQSSLVDI
eukprot:3740090-Prymnesium_polylepis.1